MRFALESRWPEAVLAIVAAALLDGLDGGVARLFNTASRFGAELDSLGDLISFGVAPGFVMFEWTLRESRGLGWIAVLAYTVCTALRLARFNTMLEDRAAPLWAKKYFTGVPAPAGGGLALLPLILYLAFGTDARLPPATSAFWMILVGGLMVSRLPTFALKGRRVPRLWVAPICVFGVLLIAALITHTWMAFSGLGTLYILSLPCGWLSYRRQMQEGNSNA